MALASCRPEEDSLGWLVRALQHASLTLRFACRLPAAVDLRGPAGEEEEGAEHGEGPVVQPDSSSIKKPARLVQGWRSLRGQLSACRAQAEERFVACFLAECMATRALG